MDETGYEIVFMGPAADTVEERERVIQGLQARFNLSRERAERLVQKAPVVVKRGLTEKERDRYVEVLHSIGAMVRVRKRPDVIREEREPRAYRPGDEGEYCPWEDMEGLGFFQAFLTTLKEVLFSPTQFYRRMPTSQGLINPLIFALIVGVLGGVLVLGLAWQQVIGFQVRQFSGIPTGILVWITIALPLIILVSLYIISTIVHLCLMVVGGNRRGFEATFRVIAYSWSTQIFALIPFIGGVITTIYALIIEVIGLRESHRIGTGRAFLAVFLPLIVVAVLFVIGATFFLWKLRQFI